jgi:hypothetical protein
MLRGPENLHLAGAIGVGLVSLAVGLLNGAVFLHPIVLAILSGTLIRLLIVAAIGAGLNAVALGSVFYAEITAQARDTERDLAFPTPAAGAPERSNRAGRLGI